MKITGISIIVVGTPWRELTFMEVLTDEGLTGLAEARMGKGTSTLRARVDELAARYLIGRDPFQIEDLVFSVERLEYERPGAFTATALSLFEVACFDIVGQALGVPVYKLLGGHIRERIPAYANGWYRVARDPKTIAERAQIVVERGYRALKLDPFGSARSDLSAAERRRSAQIVEAVRLAVGPDVAIMVEMHGRFTPAEAVRVAAVIEDYDIEWIEEPTLPENAMALRSVRNTTRIPIATGERVHHLPDARELVEGGTVDILQMDLTHFGGFTNMKRLAGWASAYYLQLAPHNVCGPVGTMAAVHFAASTPNVKVVEHFNDFADPWVNDLVDSPAMVDIVDGFFALPSGPGLGLTLSHEVAAAHPSTNATLDLFRSGWEMRGSSS